MTKTTARDLPLFLTEKAKTATKAPYRAGTASGATWELLLKNDGKSFNWLVANGGRANTLAGALRDGWVVREQAADEPVTVMVAEVEVATDETVEIKTTELNVTEKEATILKAIFNSEYGHEGDNVWTFSVTDAVNLPKRSMGGIFASLAKKGLAWSQDTFKDDDATCGLTDEGRAIVKQMLGIN